MVNGTGLTDSGLESIRTSRQLKKLFLDNTKVTDAGVSRLEGASALVLLSLGRNPSISDAAMVHLAGLPALETLFLTGTGLTDAGLARLSGLKTLRRLEVRDTKVTGRGIAALKVGLPSLRITGGTAAPRRPPSRP